MSIIEILERFLIMMVTILVIYFFINHKRDTKLQPLVIMVSICTFFLCLVFTKINISVGIGFGLFAIFSILRFRTDNFSIHTTIFLFVSITLSILNTLFPFEKIIDLLLINAVILTANIVINLFDFHYFSEKKYIEIVVTSLEYLKLTEDEKFDFIKSKTNINQFRIHIKSIDLKEDRVIIRVYH